MSEPRDRPLRWARDGAILAAGLSVLSLLLPESLGGYNPWDDPHLVVHNLAAVLIRIVIFAMVGGWLGSVWGRRRHASR